MRVWVDLTNTAHVLVLRPLVELLERDGHEVTLTARPLSHTVELLEEWGHPHTVLGRHGGATRARQGARRGRPRSRAAPLRPRPRLRLRARTRLDRPAPGVPPAADPEHDDVRLRVGVAPAPRQLPARESRAGAGRDPGRAARALRREAAEAGPLPGAEGGVLPVGLRARPFRARAARAWIASGCSASFAPRRPTRSTCSGSENALLPRLLTRLNEPTDAQTVVLTRTARAARRRSPPLGLDRADRARARGGRAQPGRVRRPARLRGRDDEPRGGGAGHAGVVDLRGPAGRRGRDARSARAGCGCCADPAELELMQQARGRMAAAGAARPGGAAASWRCPGSDRRGRVGTGSTRHLLDRLLALAPPARRAKRLKPSSAQVARLQDLERVDHPDRGGQRRPGRRRRPAACCRGPSRRAGRGGTKRAKIANAASSAAQRCR